MKNKYLPILLIATCMGLVGPASPQKALDINQVYTFIRPNNSQFWDLQTSANYEVPKGSGKNALFVGNLWFLGLKSGTQQIHGFADRYGSPGFDTYTGPLRVDGSISTNLQTVLEFGRVWKLTRTDIEALIQAQSNGTLASGTYMPPADVSDWPGNGNVGYAQQLAPFYDADSDGIYNIYQGDYPIIKGEQMLYWVLNDAYGLHNQTGAQPMGAEIHISMYACANPDAVGNESIINYTTFLEYEVVNRSLNTYEQIYAGFNTDIDIGYSFDDYIGSHADADAFYAYNGDNIDAQGSVPAPNQYGTDSPVQSIQFLEGEGFDDRTMTRFLAYYLGSGPLSDPEVGYPEQYYGLLGNYPFTYGGNGYDSITNITARYMFPGSSDPLHQGTGGIDPGFEWTQQNPCPTCPQKFPSNQMGLGATGPFTLGPGQSVKVVLGFVSTFDTTITIAERVQKNRAQNKQLKQWYQSNQLPCVHSPLSVKDNPISGTVEAYPNPAGEYTLLSGNEITPGTTYRILDPQGKQVAAGVSTQKGILYIQTGLLIPGLYLVHLENSDGKPLTVKIIKQ